MVTLDYQSDSSARDETVAIGAGILKRIAGAYDRWVARRQAIRQLYRLDRQAQKDLAIDRSEFNSIVFGDVAGRRRQQNKE